MSTIPKLGLLLATASSLCACSPLKGSVGSPSLVGWVDHQSGLPTDEPLRVTKSMRLTPGEFIRPATGSTFGEGVIILDGLKNVEVDLRGVILRGAEPGSNPDQGEGVGLMIRNCESIQVLGGRFSGYRVAVCVEGSDDVLLEEIEVSPCFGNRLIGTAALPNAGDRLQIQMDDSGDWRERYGAAIVVSGSSRVVVSDCSARGGQNGLMVLDSESCKFVSNDFSYLSGWGIALAGSEKCLVAKNRCDFVTRRGSGGRAEPDHGATGILLAGGSAGNSIISNSARHCSAGGREIFGGQASGSGNRWYANDFSEAECVSFDLDRSTDTWFVGNRIKGSHGAGVRASSTERLVIYRNYIELVHGAGLQLNQGKRALIWGNELVDCDLGLEILGAEQRVSQAGLEHRIGENLFRENVQDLVLERAVGLEFQWNEFEKAGPRVHLDGLDGQSPKEGEEFTPSEVWSWLADLQGHLPSGRSVQSRLNWPTPGRPVRLDQVRKWTPEGPHGELPELEPGAPAPLETVTILGEFGPWDPSGDAPLPAGREASGLMAGVTWDATWFTWTTESDPRGDLERWRSQRFEPVVRGKVGAWTDPWGGSDRVRSLVPERFFGLVATGVLWVEQAGTYLLSELSDDGLRLSIDGEVAIEDWMWHPERQSSREIELTAGSHRVELEYFQIDGPAVLSLDLRLPPGR